MAGHSQFKNIMHRKGKQDSIRSKMFSKLAREITVAAKTGLPDPTMNAALRLAIQNAKAQSMPKDNIDRAIKKAAGADAENYDSVRYEGYGPGGTAVIVEALTDNRNRTAGEVRTAFNKLGGTLGETGSVSFQFARVGAVRYAASAASADAMLEAAIDAGADDVESGAESHEVYCKPDELNAVRDALEAKFGAPEKAALSWRPQNMVEVAGEAAENLLKLIEALDDSDDVQTISANYTVAEAEMARLSA